MKCSDLMKQLQAYLDHDTASPLCQEFEQHLAGCDTCKLVVDNIKNSIKLVCDGTEAELPDEFKKRLHQCLKERWDEARKK